MERPNVLLVMVDHWPGRLLGAAGHEVIQTPTLDTLAQGGVRFSRAYSECPMCVPARRTLMTGATARSHGDRIMDQAGLMPDLPTLAQTFRDSGYQAYAVGKMHVFPQRSRIGFDDVVLNEEGRTQWGVTDDYEQFLTDSGFPGEQFGHGLSNNQYVSRPWHLPEDCHVTTWATRQMCRMIKRRDPTRPAFWYLSHMHPHPPLAPLRDYLQMYDGVDIDDPVCGEWARRHSQLPYALQALADRRRPVGFGEHEVRMARRAFYALCTHIDHQLRVVIGTLREEGLLGDTVILFTSDHGDMLGDHRMWAKSVFYEGSANIPMILSAPAGDDRVRQGSVDDRLVGLQDVMPTLLELAGIDVPASVEGRCMVGDRRREWLYGECCEGPDATRMLHDGRFKLIYYPAGNRVQLFDVEADPHELIDLAPSPDHVDVREHLLELLVSQLYGADLDWIAGEELVGLPGFSYTATPNRELSNQRGIH
ncbi:sulfatase-like hydrolase/transferase [Actinopolymorpha sp. B9G3]|uniref:sulfatase-like hydrolase/transferase n=1 Tax=Actinopolymorpha sp. B9G3 TaxID=3158970 RepID=UPI0032D8EEB5